VLRGLKVADVGPRNARFVLEFLATENIKVAAQDLVDVYPRKVYYYPRTGRVLMKKLRSLHNATLFEREQDYSLRLRKAKVAGEVELFG
jgi:chemotaxis protein CheD